MTNFRSAVVFSLFAIAAGCSSSPGTGSPGTGGASAGSGGRGGSGGTVTGSGGASGSGGAVSGSGGTAVGSGGTSGGSGSGGATAGSGGSTAGTGGTDGGTGGKPASDGSASDNATEKPARMCLSALGEAPGGYDWTSGDCCPFEAATAQDWCTHYAAYCKFNYPVMSNLSPGAVPLKDMADCLARFPPLTLKSRACRSNFLCNDSSLGEPPNPKTCDFPDLNRRKCDGL